ncbi:MAG: hypothetical protein OXG35_20220 [Acidobacteria bacterium]|nr:hypothetical protein [Acidobacteriota bacterium]
MPTAIGIDHHAWSRHVLAQRRTQRRRDELDVEALLDDLHITDEDERASFTGARCECGVMLLVEGDYVPYAPAGALKCAGCIEDEGGYCDGPGAIVRD